MGVRDAEVVMVRRAVSELAGAASMDEFRRQRLRAALARYRGLVARAGRGEALAADDYAAASEALDELELPASTWARDVSAVRELGDVLAKKAAVSQELDAVAGRGSAAQQEIAELEQRVLELRAQLRHNTVVIPSRYVRLAQREAELRREGWLVMLDEGVAMAEVEKRLDGGQRKAAVESQGGGAW